MLCWTVLLYNFSVSCIMLWWFLWPTSSMVWNPMYNLHGFKYYKALCSSMYKQIYATLKSLISVNILYKFDSRVALLCTLTPVLNICIYIHCDVMLVSSHTITAAKSYHTFPVGSIWSWQFSPGSTFIMDSYMGGCSHINYIPWNMHMLLCALFCCGYANGCYWIFSIVVY